MSSCLYLLVRVYRAGKTRKYFTGCKLCRLLSCFFLSSVFVQVEGKVTRPNLVEVQRVQSVSNNFDANNYNAAMQLALGQYRELFA